MDYIIQTFREHGWLLAIVIFIIVFLLIELTRGQVYDGGEKNDPVLNILFPVKPKTKYKDLHPNHEQEGPPTLESIIRQTRLIVSFAFEDEPKRTEVYSSLTNPLPFPGEPGVEYRFITSSISTWILCWHDNQYKFFDVLPDYKGMAEKERLDAVWRKVIGRKYKMERQVGFRQARRQMRLHNKL